MKGIQYHTLSRRILLRPQSVMSFVPRGRQPTDFTSCILERLVMFPECHYNDRVPNCPTINVNFGTVRGEWYGGERGRDLRELR